MSVTCTQTNEKKHTQPSYLKWLALTVTILLLAACSSAPQPSPALESSAATKRVTSRVASNGDNAEERRSGKVVTSSTDLELTVDPKRGQQTIGLRFGNVEVPRGAKVERAYIQFKADETDTGYLRVFIQGVDTDNAKAYTQGKDRDVTSRPDTKARVSWTAHHWRKTGERNHRQRTADLSPVVAEITSRKGWRSGNAMAFTISSQNKSGKRVAESYRGDKAGAPELVIEYRAAASGPSAPTPQPEPQPEPQPAPQPKAKSALYISPKGSDSNSGRSVDKPLKTIYKASQLVRPGDTVYLRGGVYKGKYQSYFAYDRSPFKVNGRKDARITIMSYPGERAIIDGSDRHWTDSKSLSSPTLFKIDADYYTVQDLTFRNGAGRGLHFKGDHHIVRNVLSHNHHSDGIYLLGSDSLFEDTVSHSNYSQQNGGDSADGIKIARGTRNTVRNFLAYNNSDDGIDIYCSTDSLVEYSAAYSNGRGYSGNGNGFKLGCRFEKNNGNMVRFNVAYKNRANNFDGNGSGGLTMLNNTSWRAGAHGFSGYSKDGMGKNVLKNNLSYQDRKPRAVDRDDSHSHNSWNLELANPQFRSLNANARDFLQLSSRSKAIDVGAKVGLKYQGKAPDLGALEQGQSVAALLGKTVLQLQGGQLLAGN